MDSIQTPTLAWLKICTRDNDQRTIILRKDASAVITTLDIHLQMAFSTIPLPQERDQVIMEIFHAEGLRPAMIRVLGRCRGALKAIIFLSDISTADGRYLTNFVFNRGGTMAESMFKFPLQSPTKDDWNSWFNFWHQFTSTGDKLKVPLGNWIHKSHRIWKWFYRPQDNNLQRIDRGTVYHYKLVTGHQGTRTTRVYHLVIREEVFSPAIQLGSPTSISGFSNQQVVKLNEGPAFPQDPEEISNFWKFLHSWEGNWMWEGIDNDQDKKSDMSWKAEGMTHNSLIWVTDGSYNRKKARDLSGVG